MCGDGRRVSSKSTGRPIARANEQAVVASQPRRRTACTPSRTAGCPPTWPTAGCRSSTWLDRGRPAVRANDGLALLYNGELYNYREPRAELQAAGRHLHHVLGHRGGRSRAGGTGGPAACDKFRGMFALRVASTTSRPASLVLGPRPRSVSSPLHYLRRKDGMVFASELKALVARVRRQSCTSSRARWLPRCSTTGSPSSGAPSRACEKLNPARAPGPGSAPAARWQVTGSLLGQRRRGRGGGVEAPPGGPAAR